MAFRRVCSYKATIKTPEDPRTYTAIRVTFRQGDITIDKDLSELSFSGNNVVVQLDQQETAMFEAKKNLYLQVRCYKGQYDAPGSKIWQLKVEDALNEEVLS